MKKITYLLFLALGVTACSVESLDSTENLTVADAKFKIQEVEKSMHLELSEICEGEAPVFVFNFPQNRTGNSVKDTDIQIQVLDTVSNEWIQFKKISYLGAGPEKYSHTEQDLEKGKYYFRASIGSGGFDYYTTLEVVSCSECEESFNYSANEDGSYTFTYIPAEDLASAEVVFTFAQSVVATGYEWPNWNGTSSTRTEIMDLEACETYTWTVSLTPDCSGNSNNSNVWTDFKVNENSKKGDLENIRIACSI